jgi:hypothetical protein
VLNIHNETALLSARTRSEKVPVHISLKQKIEGDQKNKKKSKRERETSAVKKSDPKELPFPVFNSDARREGLLLGMYS